MRALASIMILGIACFSYTAGLPQGYKLEPPSQKFETGFVNCEGTDKVCVPKNDCRSGYVSSNQLYSQEKNQQCEVSSQVCCILRNDYAASSNLVPNTVKLPSQDGGIFGSPAEQNVSPDRGYLPALGSEPSSNVDAFAEPPKEEPDNSGVILLGPEIDGPFKFEPQLGCAAALLCVEEIYCTMEGVISKDPQSLSAEQLLRRVPMVDCRNPETRVVGKCCRDPDYVDPWPTGNLPANYSGGFDEQGFPNFLNLSRKQNKPTRPVQQPITLNNVQRPQPTLNRVPQQPGESFQPSINFESVRIPVSRPNPVSPPKPLGQRFVPQRPEPLATNNQLLLGAGVQPPLAVSEDQFNQVQPIPEQSRTQSFNLPNPAGRPSNNNVLVPQNPNNQRPQFNAPRKPINAGINSQFQPNPSVFEAQPSTNVRDFIVPHQPGARCGLVNQGGYYSKDCQ